MQSDVLSKMNITIYFLYVAVSTLVMVMENPSAQCVGREFVRQYYTLLHEAPDYLHRQVLSALIILLHYFYSACGILDGELVFQWCYV